MAASPLPLSPAAETVLRFLESAGRRSEAEFYLRLFLKEAKESFALIVASESVVRQALGSLAEQLRFLSELGLRAPLVVGALSPSAADAAAKLVEPLIVKLGLTPERFAMDEPDAKRRVREAMHQGRAPLFVPGQAEPFAQVGRLARALNTRKVVVVRPEGGIGPHGSQRIDLAAGHFLQGHAGGISVINLRSDYDALLASKVLSRADTELLDKLKTALEARGSGSTTASVASPLNLLGELFTQRGTGTLVKRGAAINEFSSYQELDVGRLEALLEASFKRPLKPHFLQAAPLSVYVAEEYRGAAIITREQSGPWLSKFAVEPVAQGEGIGQDLWRALLRRFPKLFWRSRPDNPVLNWYLSVCDGHHREGGWTVMWRGFSPDQVPSLISEALGRPEDFDRPD